eukprot:7429274-Alexandrium_andersonii.AAC.1
MLCSKSRAERTLDGALVALLALSSRTVAECAPRELRGPSPNLCRSRHGHQHHHNHHVMGGTM